MSEIGKALAKEGPFAFPFVLMDGTMCSGMTLRDYFAAQALSNAAYNVCDFKPADMQRAAQLYAEAAYMVADAMLAARTK